MKIKKKLDRAKYTAMSKLIGIVIGLLLLCIICFSMVMIAITKDLSPITAMLSGGFGLAAAYVAFYIMMAKAEHIEDKRLLVKKELEQIKADGIITEEEGVRLQELQKNLEDIDVELESIEKEDIDVKSYL